MSLFQEQFSAAAKAQFEAQLSFMNSLAGKAFESIEKIAELNLNAAKASFEESSANLQSLLAAKDGQELFSLLSAQAQPNTEKVLAYGRHIGVIVSGMQNEITSAAEAQIAENSRKVGAMVDEVSKSAPAGSEPVMSLVRSAIANSNASYDKLTKTTKQAVDAIEANINNVSAQLVQNVAKANHRGNTVAGVRK